MYDSKKNVTRTLRAKEEANDYRYCPEPDLVLLDPDDGWIERIVSSMPELPSQQRERLIALAGVDLETAASIVNRGLSRLVLGALDHGADATRATNHALQNLTVSGASDLDPKLFAGLIEMETSGLITATQAKTILVEMVETGQEAASIAATRGFESMDSNELEKIVDAAIADNREAWSKFCAGEEKVQGVFVGAVMKATSGQADGKAVSAILRARRG